MVDYEPFWSPASAISRAKRARSQPSTISGYPGTNAGGPLAIWCVPAIMNPNGSLNLGMKFLYGWKMLQNGEKANAPRIQFSAKYNFVKVE